MNWNLILFVVFPYVAIVLAIVGTVYRWTRHPFSVSSVSSQLLESQKLFWGSVPFHWGILFVLLGHLVALVLPAGVAKWNQVPIRLYLLEFTGLALAVWALVYEQHFLCRCCCWGVYYYVRYYYCPCWAFDNHCFR